MKFKSTDMFTKQTTGWSFMRLLRLIAGITALIFAIIYADRFLGLAGIVLLSLSVLNIGCCSVGGCSTSSCKPSPDTTVKVNSSESISYEEVV